MKRLIQRNIDTKTIAKLLPAANLGAFSLFYPFVFS